MRFDIKGHTAEVSEEDIKVYKGEELFLTVPLSFSINGESSVFSECEFCADGMRLLGSGEKLSVGIHSDCFTLSYEKAFERDTEIYEVRGFVGGLELNGFDRAFTPQARNNSHKNIDWFSHFPDISSNGYFTPSLLQFSIGSKLGWVGVGLLDIPDTKQCLLDGDMTFLIQSSGGNIRVRAKETFKVPEVVIYFPGDEWESISDFREKLIEFGKYTPKKPEFDKTPSWWRRPMICIYGDQLIEERVGQLIDEEWVEGIVKQAEGDWGLQGFNLVIDDSWQLPHSMIPVVDTKRFPDLRGFIERMHAKGIRVLLWMTPMMEKITNGYRTRSEELGIITDYACPSPYYKDFPGTYFIDYTHDNAEVFIKEMTEFLFGGGEGQLNCDGVKLDFLANNRDPSLTRTYSHSERGIGMKEMYRFYKLFYEATKRVKADAIVNATVGDPRFEDFVDLNRMHDTHSGNLEKILRVKVSSLACPKLIIDSDGAHMFKSWLIPHYIDSVIYGIPANYYTGKYQDYRMRAGECKTDGDKAIMDEYVDMTEKEKRQVGNLFSMIKHRPRGEVIYNGNGFTLTDGERINGISIGGHTAVYYPTEENPKGYIITFLDEACEIPLFDRKFGRLDGELINGNIQVDYARDRVILHLKKGEIYTFEDIDEGNSLDAVFKAKAATVTEKDMDYVN